MPVEECVDMAILRLEEYTKKRKESVMSSASDL